MRLIGVEHIPHAGNVLAIHLRMDWARMKKVRWRK